MTGHMSLNCMGLASMLLMPMQSFALGFGGMCSQMTINWCHTGKTSGSLKSLEIELEKYAFFGTGFWISVRPGDHKLVQYWEDLW